MILNSQNIIIICLIVVILVYCLILVYNKPNSFENFQNIGVDTNDPTFDIKNVALLPDPIIYKEAYSKTNDLSNLLKLNLRIDPLNRDYEPNTNKAYKRLLVPIHITLTLNGECLAVFNDGKLYKKDNLIDDNLWIGPLQNSLYGSQETGIGMRMIMFFPLNNNQERDIRLFAVGADNCLYYKENDHINSAWVKAPIDNNSKNNDLVYLFCDYYEKNLKYPLLYGITTNGSIVYKNDNGAIPPDTIEEYNFVKLPFTLTTPIISSNIKMLKVYWDRNGFMIGIGQDFKLYQKKGIDWKIRPWEVDQSIRGKNPGSSTKVIDMMMDYDARMFGLILDSDKNDPMIKIQKQEQSYYLADFKSLKDNVSGDKLYNLYQIIKFKSGLDWEAYFNFEDADELFYRDANLQGLYQKSVMKDRLKLREMCKNRNPLVNTDARNFDLEKKIEERGNKISVLNKELMGLLTYGSLKMNNLFDSSTPSLTPSSISSLTPSSLTPSSLTPSSRI
jgi:hypothetical protein